MMQQTRDGGNGLVTRAAPTSWLERPEVALPILLIVALVLRLPNLGRSLWYDEVLYSTRYQARDWHTLFHFVMYGPFAPLYPVLAFLWTGLVGETEILVRTPSLVCGLASIALVYRIAKRFGTGSTPFLAALILSVSPVHVWYSQEATPYVVAMAFMLAAIAGWIRVAQSPFRSRWDGIYAGALLAAVMSHFFVAALLLPLTVLTLRVPEAGRRRILAVNIGVAGLLACLLAAKYWNGALAADRGFLRPFTMFEWWMLMFNWFLHGNALWTVGPFRANVSYLVGAPVLLALQAAAALLVVRGLVPGGRNASRAAPAWELASYLLCLPGVVWLLTTAGYRHVYVERYLIFALPFFAIALARGATRSTSARAATALAGALVALGIASYVACLGKPTTWTVYKHNPDWQSTVRYLKAEEPTPDPVVVFAAVPIDDLKYYLRRDLRGRHADAKPYVETEFDRVVAAQRRGPIHLVDNLYWANDFDRLRARAEQNGLRLAGLQSFNGVALYTYRPSDAGRRTSTKGE